ncbi:TPA: ash family protein [Enterobacter kobei]
MIARQIMVARAGPTSVGPVPVYAGYANPVRAITMNWRS